MKKSVRRSLGLFVAGLILLVIGFGGGYLYASADSVSTLYQSMKIAMYIGGGLILISLVMFVLATAQGGKEV